MDFKLKIVTKLPLESLWNETELVDAKKVGPLTTNDIKELLPAAQFVVADIGYALRWIDTADTFEFWRKEVQRHLIEPQTEIYLEELPNNYGYRGTAWTDELSKRKIILLEKFH